MHSSSTTKHKKTKNNNKSKSLNQDSENDISTSDNISNKSRDDANNNKWKQKNIDVIANTPIFNENRFYGDGTTSEELQSSANTTFDQEILEEEEEISLSAEGQVSRDIQILNAEDLSSASSINTSDMDPLRNEDFQVSSDQKKKTKKVKKIKRIRKKKIVGANSSSAVYESESETLANYSDQKTPNDTLSKFDNDESSGSKFYFNSEALDAPAVRRAKKKIDDLMSPRSVNSQITKRGLRVRYTDEEPYSPRKKQKDEYNSGNLDNSNESDSAHYWQLSSEKHHHNVTESEISDISQVEFDTPRCKYLKSPAKDVFYNDSDYAFNENLKKHENDSISSNSSYFQTRDIELENSLGSEDEITDEIYEEAQRKIQKYAIEDNEVQENGALFDIKIPDSDEEGKLLLDLKKNAIMLSSSSSQESDVEDEDELEMLGEMVVKRGLPFLKLSDSESEGDPLDANENANKDAENTESLLQYQNEDSSEPPIQYDPLLAPKSLTTPRSPRTPRTPNEPLYTGNLVLTITVIEAINLPKTMPKIRLEPYVLFKLKGSKEFQKTKTCRWTNANLSSKSSKSSNSNTNVYSFDNQQIIFVIDPNQKNILSIKVRDEDKFGGDKDVSGYDFVLSNLNVGETSDGWFRLTSLKNTDKGGKLHVIFNLEREIKPEPPHTPKSPKTPKNTNDSQNSEHSQNSKPNSSAYQNNEENTISQDDIEDDLSSISEGNRKRGSNDTTHSISESENDDQTDTNLNSNSDLPDSSADQNLLSPSDDNLND